MYLRSMATLIPSRSARKYRLPSFAKASHSKYLARGVSICASWGGLLLGRLVGGQHLCQALLDLIGEEFLRLYGTLQAFDLFLGPKAAEFIIAEDSESLRLFLFIHRLPSWRKPLWKTLASSSSRGKMQGTW